MDISGVRFVGYQDQAYKFTICDMVCICTVAISENVDTSAKTAGIIEVDYTHAREQNPIQTPYPL